MACVSVSPDPSEHYLCPQQLCATNLGNQLKYTQRTVFIVQNDILYVMDGRVTCNSGSNSEETFRLKNTTKDVHDCV